MTQIPIILLSLMHLAQTPVAQGPQQPAQPTTPAVEGVAPGAKADEQTEADKFVEDCAKRIDAIEYLSTKMIQTIRAGGKSIAATGTYKRGPGNLARLDLEVDIGTGVARRVNASDGTTCTMYEKVFDQQVCQTFDVRQVMPLWESRDIAPEFRQQSFMDLPFVSPADMLRGYLKTIRFEKMTDGVVGEKEQRPVTVVEGSWRPDWISIVAQDANVTTLDALAEPIPQHLRLHLDKETGFPLRIELYRTDKRAEYKPIYRLDFTDVRTEKIDSGEFAFTPPDGVVPADVTAQRVAELSQLPEKPQDAGKPSDPSSVAEPLQKSP